MTPIPSSTIPFSGRMWIVGAGRMAGAMVRRWIASGLDPARITAIRPSGKPVADGVRVVTSIDALSGEPAPDLMLLGVKPQMLADVAPGLVSHVGATTMMVSILAGVPLADLRQQFPDAGAVLRLMPNLPVEYGRGVAVLIGADEGSPARTAADLLATPLGLSLWARDEAEFESITALAGCGPAFTYRFIGALAGAATRLGLDADRADALARATVFGAAADASETDGALNDMASAVASKGGMTQAGLDVLDEDGRLFALLTDTLRAARDRGRELAEIARPSE